MRFLVTNQTPLFREAEQFIIVDPKFCLRYFEDKKIIGLDTETEGFDPYTKRILLCQLGDSHNQFAIDYTVDLKLFKDLLEDTERLFLLHNAKFDLRFFLHQNIVITNVYDSFLAEKLLWLGYPPGIHSMALDACCERYLNVKLDKSIRGLIHKEGLSDRVITYGCNDVKYLLPLREAQLLELKKNGLETAVEVENKFVIVLAYIEYCGVKLDSQAWRNKMHRDLANLQEAEYSLSKWVVDNGPEQFVNKIVQGDLFASVSGEPTCKINWASSKQVVPFFKSLGFDLKVKDKQTGRLKDSVDAKVIKPQSHLSPVATLYLKYKEYAKIVDTYGQTFLDAINPVSHRIHTVFNQLMDTGRLSCGGGVDKDSGRKLLNLQNLPKNPETRSSFIPEEGNVWISADYCSQESVIITNISEDPALIKFFQEGKGDIHSLAAKMAFPQKLANIPLEEVKEKDPHTRDLGKKVEFVINYGGNGLTISQNLSLPPEEGNSIYDAYMQGFKGLKRYQDFCRRDVMQKGFILLSPITGHKAYIYDFDKLQQHKEEMNSPGFWDAYRADKALGVSSERVELVRHFFRRKANSEKQSINYRIQGCGALCFKFASIKFYNYLLDNNLLFKVKYTIPVHDEINVECPEELADTISKELVRCMKSAGDIFCKIIRLEADVNIGKCWIH